MGAAIGGGLTSNSGASVDLQILDALSLQCGRWKTSCLPCGCWKGAAWAHNKKESTNSSNTTSPHKWSCLTNGSWLSSCLKC